MKQIITLYLLLWVGGLQAQGAGNIFKVEVSYYAQHKCPHQIQGEVEAQFHEYSTGFLWQDRYIVTTYHGMASACDAAIRVYDEKGRHRPAYFRVGDSLLDIAILELCDVPKDMQSFVIAQRNPAPRAAVQIRGFGKGQQKARSRKSRIVATEVCMPGCYGSHKLALSLDQSIPKGYSGSPLVIQNKVVGIIQASNPKDGMAYALSPQILRKKLMEMLEKGYIDRPFYGMVLTQTEQGVQLQDALDSAPFGIRKHRGSLLKKINNRAVQQLEDVRTLFEQWTPSSQKLLQLEFQTSSGQAKLVSLPFIRFSYPHREEIARYCSTQKILPFSLKNTYINLEVKKVHDRKIRHIQSGDRFEVITFPQVSQGIRCRDVWDLGLVLKTFSSTRTPVTFFFHNRKKLSTQMPRILFH